MSSRGKRPECKCDELVKQRIAALEMNVDSLDRGASEYQQTIAYAKSLCPVHGKARS